MGNCITLCSSSNKSKALPIDTIFNLPAPIPSWPSEITGGGFGSGIIDLGGLQVRQISTFRKVWATYEGGPDDLGATFFEPSPIPDGFSMLGCYSQPNNQPLFGWVLVGKDLTNDASGETLKKPIDYTLVWSTKSLKNGEGYIWLPTPPDGYQAVGHVVTNSPDKPSPDKIRCVRSDLTAQCETSSWIWGLGTESNSNGFNVYSLQPSKRGTNEPGVSIGTFIATNNTSSSSSSSSSLSLSCLKNGKFDLSSMPNLSQIKALFQAYSPWIYFHPKEIYLPSSVSWYFSNGALLYKKGDESNPVPIDPTGSNLPQGGSNDGTYWMDLPIDESAKEKVKEGDLQSSEAYLHVKPMLGATFTDIAVWIFYPFNGPATAKLELIDIPLGKVGEHVGDWEHLTLRVSNFTGVLYGVYFSEHSGGTWVDASLLEFQGGNKAVAYSSLNGHALYSKPGLVLQGGYGIGIRNDTAKSEKVVDTGARYSVVSAGYLENESVEPPWLSYAREWGPKVTYKLGVEVQKVGNSLSGEFKSLFQSLVNLLPDEVLGEEGPTGPKMKNNWNGDEVGIF